MDFIHLLYVEYNSQYIWYVKGMTLSNLWSIWIIFLYLNLFHGLKLRFLLFFPIIKDGYTICRTKERQESGGEKSPFAQLSPLHWLFLMRSTKKLVIIGYTSKKIASQPQELPSFFNLGSQAGCSCSCICSLGTHLPTAAMETQIPYCLLSRCIPQNLVRVLPVSKKSSGVVDTTVTHYY